MPILLLLVALFLAIPAHAQLNLRVHNDPHHPGVTFALADLHAQAARQPPGSGGLTLELVSDGEHPPQSYRIGRDADRITATAPDPAGLMYAVHHLAEQLHLGTAWNAIADADQQPFIARRGIKFNIPLDARLPSYDDTGDAAQQNIGVVWSMDFWRDYLDALARNRTNVVALWSKHPFPALVKLPDHPDAALDDVYAFAGRLTPQTSRDWDGIDLHAPEHLRRVKRMTIDEKVAFWQQVMAYGHDRGITFLLFTWNIFLPEDGRVAALRGKAADSPEALAYVQANVRALVDTYPHLSGIGVTAGERMGRTVGDYTNVQWLWQAYGKGMAAALDTHPNRELRFIFRRHHTNLDDIDRDFTAHYPGPVETSFKYSAAHMYSTPEPHIYDAVYREDVARLNYRCWMNVRNDDIFVHRWGSPAYARDYLRNLPHDHLAGIMIGSDGYVWGREFIAKDAALAGELETDKHWYRELIWHRLAYNPDLSEGFFVRHLAKRFPQTDAAGLFAVWQTASRVFPLINRFHWKGADQAWLADGCIAHTGFVNVREFIDANVLQRDRQQNIPDFVADRLAGRGAGPGVQTPPQVAEAFLALARRIETQLAELPVGEAADARVAAELKATLADLACFGHYADYYGHKIAGATHLHWFERLPAQAAGKPKHQRQAVTHLRAAADAWNRLADVATGHYHPQLTARTDRLDWDLRRADVAHDVQIARDSTGVVPRVAKLFSSDGRGTPATNALAAALERAGYTVTRWSGWQLGAHVTGTKILHGTPGGAVHRQFVAAGGELPADFPGRGYAVIERDQKWWVFRKDGGAVAPAAEALIKELVSP